MALIVGVSITESFDEMFIELLAIFTLREETLEDEHNEKAG